MSAIRANANRRSNRSEISSPYGRRLKRRNSDDTSNQSSGWGISRFLFGLFKRASPQDDENPLYEEPTQAAEMDSSMEEARVFRRSPSIEEISPPQALSKHTEPPRTPSIPSDDGQSSTSKVQQVTKYLTEKGNQPLNNVEVAGLVALLEASVQGFAEELNPPFRFSPSPLTTSRGVSPNSNFMGPSSSAPALATSTSAHQTSGRSLFKNPNGVYRWQGAGSARPRTRYQSPGFGTSRSMPIKMKLTSEVSTSDKKRRRVAQDDESPSTQRASMPAGPSSSEQASATAGPSAPSANGALRSTSPTPPRSNGVVPPTTPHIRTHNISTKPTAPAVPSPLRQAWNQNESPSPPQPAPASKPTRAANIMSELIKEVSPAPKPDFSNPYDSVGPVPAKTATRRPVAKRSRVVAASHPDTKKDEKKITELSPQKIIEATVPKGSKRARPPPGLDSIIPQIEAPEPVAPRRSSRLKSPEPRGINGIIGSATGSKPAQAEQQDESPTKKQKTGSSPALMKGRRSTVTIEEVEDVDMPSSNGSYSNVTRPAQVIEPEENLTPRQRSQSPTASTSPTSPVRNHFGPKSSVPKAPSKLRYSIQVEGETDKGEDDEKKPSLSSSSLPPAASSSSQSSVSAPSVSPSPPIAPSSSSSSSRRGKMTAKSEAEVKAEVLAVAPHELPSFTFALATSSPGAGPGPSSQKSRDAAKAASASSLPSFDFSVSARMVTAAPTGPEPSEGFNFAAAGLKPPAASAGERLCSECMLKNPAVAAEKCSTCNASQSKAVPSPAAGGFNWAAAGMKKPETAGGSSWTCSVCMLSNPASATTKCSICDAPR